MTIDDFKHIELPDNPGVYFFRQGKHILYIGKATSLKDRVRSYFSSDLIKTRGLFLVDMVTKADSITFEETASALEALLLETELIKKHIPHYNTKEKDDKSYSYVAITNETYPTVLIVRGRNLERQDQSHYRNIFGPFTSGMQLREALHITRKIFPYKDDKCKALSGKMCFNASIGLCPGVCVGAISVKDYEKLIKKLVLFLSGNTKKVLNILEKEMFAHAKAREFEKADVVKRKIYALTHIHDISLIKRERPLSRSMSSGESGKKEFRIEAYDIAHMQGKSMVGVMVVMIDGELRKDQYRKFVLQTVKTANDPAALKEILTRRLAHAEWDMPDVIVVDGNHVQKNVAEQTVPGIRVISVVKDDKHKAREMMYAGELDPERRGLTQEDIYEINAEAHRFAIAYFRKKQRKDVYL